MSKGKIEKYLERPWNFKGRLYKHALLLSDSKGFSLKPHLDLLKEFNHNIEINCESGAQLQRYLNWLHQNLWKKVNQHGQLVLYIFLGTCDLTCKLGRFIQLRHSDEFKAFAYIQSQIEKYLNLISHFRSVNIVFFEIPHYSIVAWNSAKGHKDPDSFHLQDLKLTRTISLVNELIREVNDRNNVASPNFKLDLLKYRKSKGGKQRKSLNFKNYKDGVHPTSLLARCWMKRIVARILTDCS